MGWKRCVISTEPEGALESCAVARECRDSYRASHRDGLFASKRRTERTETEPRPTLGLMLLWKPNG